MTSRWLPLVRTCVNLLARGAQLLGWGSVIARLWLHGCRADYLSMGDGSMATRSRDMMCLDVWYMVFMCAVNLYLCMVYPRVRLPCCKDTRLGSMCNLVCPLLTPNTTVPYTLLLINTLQYIPPVGWRSNQANVNRSPYFNTTPITI